MSYFPVVWLLIWLVRLILREKRSREGGSGDAPAVPPGGELGAANLLVFAATLLGAPVLAFVLGATASAPFPEDVRGAVVLLVFPFGFLGAFGLPHWFAWRLLGPWRLQTLGRWVLPFGLYASVASRRGAPFLYAARFGAPKKRLDPRGADANRWTIAAAALRAEDRGAHEEAGALLGLLAVPPRKIRNSRRPAVVAAEALAWSALRRGDWRQALARAEAARSRGTALARRLAAARSGEGVPRRLLLFSWLLAPDRLRSWPTVRETLAAVSAKRGRGGEPPLERTAARFRQSPLPTPRAVGAARAHLALLAHVAAGGVPRTLEVERLAEGWSDLLAAEAATSGLLRRAMELGGSEVSTLPEALRSSLLAELGAMAEGAEGAWTAHEDTLAGSLRRRALEASYAAVEEEIAAFERVPEGEESRPMAAPLEELERWLALRARVGELVAKGEGDALRTAWFGGLRFAACNWGVFLVRQRGAGASWAAYFMHGWSAELAAEAGDGEIATLSRENAELTRSRLV